MMLFVSITIPTFNREKELYKAIQSILTQSYKDFELIVIDNGPSTDNTENVVKSFSQNNARIRYISTTLKGCIFARNIGAENAKGEILVTLDDDIEFIEPDTLRKLVRTYKEDSSIGIVGGIELRVPDQVVKKRGQSPLPPETGRISSNGEFNTSFSLIEGYGITEVDHVRSAFMAVRKDIFKKVGGFDEVYNACGMGFRYESDLCLKVQRSGYKVVVNPEIKIWHKGSVRSRGFARGRGLKYFLYANRNQIFFMRRFFWQTNPFRHLFKDILIGHYRTPGIIGCFKRFLSEKNLIWLPYAFAIIFGKINGYVSYNRYAKKNPDYL